jgi:hypothetical protein
VNAASATSGGAAGGATGGLGSGNAGGATAGSGSSGAANTGSANAGSANAGSANAGSSNAGSAHSSHGTAGGTSFLAQLTSGSPVHLPATHDSVPLNVAAGLLLVGGIALGPTRRRQFARLAHTPRHRRGAHFTRAN